MAKYYNMAPASRFFCTQCGREGISVTRKKGQERKSGHLKKLFCLYCQEEVNHAEIRPHIDNYTYEDFKEEFDMGRFKDGQRSSMDELYGCSKSDCPFNVNGKCWNSNNSVGCEHKPIKEI